MAENSEQPNAGEQDGGRENPDNSGWVRINTRVQADDLAHAREIWGATTNTEALRHALRYAIECYEKCETNDR